MAASRKSAAGKSAQASKAGRPAGPAKRQAKQPGRWNDPPARGGGSAWGLMLILVGLAGLGLYACGPKASRSSGPPPVAQAPARPSAAAPDVPRGRYTPPRHRIDVAEVPRPERAEPASRGGEAAEKAQEIEIRPQPAETVEPTVRLTPEPSRAEAPGREPVAVAPAGEFERNPGAPGTVALTFDGCYDDKPLPTILRALDHHGYKATFFIAGRFAQRYPSSVKRIAGDGMEIGNHSWSHPAFTRLSDASIDRELTRTSDLIEELTGRTPTLFRPPFGDRNDRVRRLVAGHGCRTVCWALDSWDSVKKGITSEEITQRVLSRVKPGDVVLMHIGSEATADALEPILQGLDARGLRVVPVSELMAS